MSSPRTFVPRIRLSLLFVLVAAGTGARAADPPGVTLSTYCTTPMDSGKPLIDHAVEMFEVDSVPGVSLIRRTMATKIANAYVKPALIAGCREKAFRGFEFIKSIEAACSRGCDERIEDWPALVGAVRDDQITICKADCRAGVYFMFGSAIGYDTGRAAENQRKQR